MGLFSKKDWNIIAVTYERSDAFRVNGNRAQGRLATKTRDGAKKHNRTIFWAVFDQEGHLLESDVGRGGDRVPPETLQRVREVLMTNRTILRVRSVLESGETELAAKPLIWNDYPKQTA